MTRRTERIASLIRDVVADAILTRLSDPRIEPLTSITRVEVSADLSIARVNVSVMNDNPARRELSVRALRGAAGRLRGMVGERLSARIIPRLEFHLDDSVRRGIETVQALERVLGPQPGALDADAQATDHDDDDSDGPGGAAPKTAEVD